MFALRGIAISFSVFFMVYCALSVAVSVSWRRVYRRVRHYRVHCVADLLFAIRIFPFVSAAMITAAFTVPSFLLLEPRTIKEPLGGAPLALGICGALLGGVGIARAMVALLRASRNVSGWTVQAEAGTPMAKVPVLRIRPSIPAMTAAGILRPRVLVSGSAESLLSGAELQTTLRHEIAHVRRRDNLKKLLLCVMAFPGMRKLESEWLEATEMAADDAAVSNAGEALDLAAALIKLSRLGSNEAVSDLTAALVQTSASIMNARVERLIRWTDERREAPRQLSIGYGLGAAVIIVTFFAFTYLQLLSELHTATEWLMR
ncbi:MAG TPA: M56 family metallopeptidase [Candidatus Acidoferrales bacterium]|nr:M56 family metallopeptidase [Candidatus Acidoferrales bacterium]